MLELLLKIMVPVLLFLGLQTTPSLTQNAPTPTVTVKTTPTKKPKPPAVPAKIIPLETPPEKPTEPTPLLNLTVQNELQRNATVNILCTTKISGSFAPISGSGVIIDPRGVILTNAHVAQYYLLQNFRTPGFIECTIRTGSPARPAYRAELIHISEQWIHENAQKITAIEATGTGKNDFALLQITEAVPGTTLPPVFPFVETDTTFTIIPNALDVLLASYPAEFAGGIATQKDLHLVSSTGTIKRAFFFDTPGKVDLFSIGGNIIAQGGSSGGGIASRETGKLMGIIVTSTDAKTTDEKDLHAVTTTHISESLATERGVTLTELLAGDPKVQGALWRTLKFESLKKELADAILQD